MHQFREESGEGDISHPSTLHSRDATEKNKGLKSKECFLTEGLQTVV